MSIHVEKMQRPHITEIQVRMDCRGCEQKIRRALQSLHGIYDVYMDFPNQRVTVVGWVEPDKVMKAIKKAGKIAKLCSHSISPGGDECSNGDQNAVSVDRADAAAASSSASTTVTQDPVENSNVHTVTDGCGNPEAGGAGDEPPPEQQPAEETPAEAAPPQEEQTADPPPPTEENAGPDPPIDYTSHYMNIEGTSHAAARHGYLIRNLDGYQVAQEYQLRDAENYYRAANEYNHADPQQARRYNQYYNDRNNSNNNNNAAFSRQSDSSRFAAMFSDENPNACAIA